MEKKEKKCANCKYFSYGIWYPECWIKAPFCEKCEEEYWQEVYNEEGEHGERLK